MRIHIGITGLSGTGKDTVADMLAKLAGDHGLPVHHRSLSDEVREELIRRGRVDDLASRTALIEVANELRAAHGGGFLASCIAKELEATPDGDSELSLVIVTGIRNPEEVRAFRGEWGRRFFLVAVEASQEARIARMVLRRQYQEDSGLSAEVEQADRAIGIDACSQMADWHIRNDGTFEELQSAVRAFFEHSVISAHT